MTESRREFLRAFPRTGLIIPAFSAVQAMKSLNAADTKAAAFELLSGNSLDGWESTDFYKPGKVQVKDGVLRLGKGNPMTGVTSVRKDLPKSHFEITFEARRLEGDDFFAAVTFPVNSGFLTFVNGGWSGNITGLSSIDGSDASENETSCVVKFENEIWYQIKVRVQDEHVQCFVDDKKVVDFDGSGRSLKTRVESRPSQPLGFACYDCESEIRKVILRSI